MPKVKVNGINMNYEQTGSGEPLVLIPFLTADNACYAFQLPEYSKHFTCFSIDPRGAGETDKPAGPYSTEMMADDVAGFMQAVGIEKAHVVGTSFDCQSKLGSIKAPTLLTFGMSIQRDNVTPDAKRKCH